MNDVELTISARRPRLPAGRSDPSGARLVLTLAVAGFLSGLALAGVYELTLPAIERNQAIRREAAVLTVVPGADTLQQLTWAEQTLRPVRDGERVEGLAIFAAYAGRDFRGYAIEGEGPGFQDAIRLIFGFDPGRGQVIGMQVLESRETPGLGDKIYKDASFVANFDDLVVDPTIALVKDGRTSPNEVDAITGATISARAVVTIIDRTLRQWRPRLPDEPPPPPDVEAGGG